jgi:hypothetical protein
MYMMEFFLKKRILGRIAKALSHHHQYTNPLWQLINVMPAVFWL